MSDFNENENVVELQKEVVSHGEPVSKLTFREPTGEDIMKSGHPMKITVSNDGGGQTMSMDTQALGTLISRLAEIPASSVRAMSVSDFQSCTNVIMGFFGDSLETE
ncbi:MAG: phage tail assembly protein [Sneathiella sp.]